MNVHSCVCDLVMHLMCLTCVYAHALYGLVHNARASIFVALTQVCVRPVGSTMWSCGDFAQVGRRQRPRSQVDAALGLPAGEAHTSPSRRGAVRRRQSEDTVVAALNSTQMCPMFMCLQVCALHVTKLT